MESKDIFSEDHGLSFSLIASMVLTLGQVRNSYTSHGNIIFLLLSFEIFLGIIYFLQSDISIFFFFLVFYFLV